MSEYKEFIKKLRKWDAANWCGNKLRIDENMEFYINSLYDHENNIQWYIRMTLYGERYYLQTSPSNAYEAEIAAHQWYKRIITRAAELNYSRKHDIVLPIEAYWDKHEWKVSHNGNIVKLIDKSTYVLRKTKDNKWDATFFGKTIKTVDDVTEGNDVAFLDYLAKIDSLKKPDPKIENHK